MKQFLYKAVTTNGQRIEGVVEAKDQAKAVETLREQQLLVVKIQDRNKNWQYQLSLHFNRISSSDLTYFTRQLATMLEAGLPILTTLQLLKKRFRPAMAQVIEDITTRIEGGESFYQAVLQHPAVFPPLYISLVKAGETSGLLGKVMGQLAFTLEKQQEFMGRVKSSMMYPVIVLIAMFLVGGIMVFFVIPKMAELYSQFEVDLPLMTEIVISTSEAIRRFWFLIPVVVLGGGFALVSWLKTPKGKEWFDKTILRIPYLGDLVDKIVTTNVMWTLSLLTESGVAIVDALNISSQITSNLVYRRGMSRAIQSVEKGLPLAAAFTQENFLPEAVTQMMAVGEETGKLDEMLGRIAKQYEKESLLSLKSLTSIIEPLLIIILGVGVGVLIIAIIVPIYNLTSAI